MKKELSDSILNLAEMSCGAYETGNIDRIQHYEGLVKNIKMFCKSFEPKIEKTPFEYNEYLSARLGGMSHEEIKTDSEIRDHYDFSNVDGRRLQGFFLEYTQSHK